MSEGVLRFRAFECDVAKILKSRGLDTRGKVQQYIDSEVLRLDEPFVPRDTGTLIDSGIINTQIGSGEVKYNTPYARRWYYMPAQFQGEPMRGNYWFERMKQQYKDAILKGAQERAK